MDARAWRVGETGLVQLRDPCLGRQLNRLTVTKADRQSEGALNPDRVLYMYSLTDLARSVALCPLWLSGVGS